MVIRYLLRSLARRLLRRPPRIEYPILEAVVSSPDGQPIYTWTWMGRQAEIMRADERAQAVLRRIGAKTRWVEAPN